MYRSSRQLATIRLTRISVHSRASPRICKHRLLCMVALLLPRPTLDGNSTTPFTCMTVPFILSTPIRSSLFYFSFLPFVLPCLSRFRDVKSEAALSRCLSLTSSFVAWRGVEERDGGGRGGPAGMGWKRKREGDGGGNNPLRTIIMLLCALCSVRTRFSGFANSYFLRLRVTGGLQGHTKRE